MDHLFFILGVLTTATVFALLEVQIEGSNGWAAALPTWRIDNRFTQWLCGHRPLTGYHFYTHLLVFMLLHSPFWMSMTVWSWAAEARVIAFLTLFYIIEDFLWFMFNPAYGIKRFAKQHIWWHAPSWWWIMPRDYWMGLLLGGTLYWLSV